MKKLGITLITLTIIILCLIGLSGVHNQSTTEYLRIHVRANSNEENDQEVKLKVKDGVVEYLTPLLTECKEKSDAIKILTDNKTEIEAVCDKVLRENGYEYTSKANVKNENFPTRVYGEFTLEEGFYDALIITLGEGKGDNWWCVVYPPLCFINGNGNYIYKSKIIEIINNFKNKYGGKDG